MLMVMMPTSGGGVAAGLFAGEEPCLQPVSRRVPIRSPVWAMRLIFSVVSINGYLKGVERFAGLTPEVSSGYVGAGKKWGDE